MCGQRRLTVPLGDEVDTPSITRLLKCAVTDASVFRLDLPRKYDRGSSNCRQRLWPYRDESQHMNGHSPRDLSDGSESG